MGWLSRFVLGKPRTAEGIVPVIDLVARTICGLGSTSTRDEIEARLGPADDAGERKQGRLNYPQIGLQLALDPQLVLVGFSIFTAPGVFEAYTFEPGRRTTVPDEAWFVSVLGPPTKRESDDDELMLEWTRGDEFLGVDFALDGTLQDILVDYR